MVREAMAPARHQQPSAPSPQQPSRPELGQKSHECSTPSVVSAATTAKGVGKRRHKWISDTMWQAADTGATTAGKKRSPLGLRLTPLDLVHSNYNFSSSSDETVSAPPSTDRRSVPSARSTKAFWRVVPASRTASTGSAASPLPKCAQQYESLKSLEQQVQLKAKRGPTLAPQTFAWSDDESDMDSDDDCDTPQSLVATAHGCSLHSPSSLLSGELPFVQGLLFAESLSDAVNNGDPLGMATPQAHGSPR